MSIFKAIGASARTQAHLFAEGPAGRTDDAATLAELEVDYTPEGVAVLCTLGLRQELGLHALHAPARVLHPSAGSACWARAVRAAWVPTRIVGVEPRHSERGNLEAACDESYGMTCAEFIRVHQAVVRLATPRAPFDLVLDNPPFSAFEGLGWPVELLRAGLLNDDAVVAFYGLTQWGQSDGAQSSLREWSPKLQLRLGGRIAHRGGGQADAREYSLWVWSVSDRAARREFGTDHRGHRIWTPRPSWDTVQLPMLPAHLRRWSPDAVPGTRPIPQAIVDTCAALLRGVA